MAVYVVIGNSGSAPDTLVAVSSPAATRGSVHATRNSGGMSGMGPAGALAVEPGGVLTMEPGGIHVMLDELLVPVVAGDSITLQLEFTRTGSIAVTLPVVTYGDVRSRLGRYATDPD